MDLLELANNVRDYRSQMPIILDDYSVNLAGVIDDFITITGSSSHALLASIHISTMKITIFPACINRNLVDDVCEKFNIEPYTYYVMLHEDQKIPEDMKYYSFRAMRDCIFYEPLLFVAGKDRIYVPGRVPGAAYDYFDKCTLIFCVEIMAIINEGKSYNESEILCVEMFSDKLEDFHLIFDLCKALATKVTVKRVIAFHNKNYCVIADIHDYYYKDVDIINGNYIDYVSDYFKGCGFVKVKSASSA